MSSEPTDRRRADCQLVPDPGPCADRLPMFYYDAARGGCATFQYGGCQGNPNRFADMAECVQFCSPPTAVPSTR